MSKHVDAQMLNAAVQALIEAKAHGLIDFREAKALMTQIIDAAGLDSSVVASTRDRVRQGDR